MIGHTPGPWRAGRIQELEAKIAKISAELEAMKAQPEWVPFPGELAEVSDDRESWQVRPVLEYNPDADYPYISDAVNWRHARPLSDPNIIQLRPHTPGDPMPCEGGERVLYRIGGGMLCMSMRAGDLDWSRRIDWAPIPRVPL